METVRKAEYEWLTHRDDGTSTQYGQKSSPR